MSTTKVDALSLQKATGIPKEELIFHLLTGLGLVSENLQRYPENIQLRKAEFVFLTKEKVETGGKVAIFVGFEHAKSKEYSKSSSATFDFDKKLDVIYDPSAYRWKELGFHLQLEFAGQIMREIGIAVLSSIRTGRPLPSLIIDQSFVITNSNVGLLGLKLFDESMDASARFGSIKTVSNTLKLTFSLKEQSPKPTTIPNV